MNSPTTSSTGEFQVAVLELLRQHRVACELDGEWISINNGSSRLRASSRAIPGAHQLCSDQFDVCFVPWPGCCIVESFAGIGDTSRDRMLEALKSFAENTLHILLRVFCDVPANDQTSVSLFENSGVDRRVTYGKPVLRGSPASDQPVFGPRTFQSVLASVPIPEGTHWVRLFCAQQAGQLLGFELLLDNQRWEAAEADVRSNLRLSTDGYASLRLFCVVEGGTDVCKLLGQIIHHPEEEDEKILVRLRSKGMTQIEAQRMLLMAPMPFAAKILNRLGLKTSTIVTIDNGRFKKTVNLERSQLFRTIRDIADTALETGAMTKEEFMALAGRDASYNAVNNALFAGASLEGAKLSGTVVFWNEPLPFVETSGTKYRMGPRPWWQFWRR